MAAATTDCDEMLAGALERFGRCLPLAGTPDFLEPFLETLHNLGASQCMVFSYTPDLAGCLLARNFAARATGRELADDYLTGWYAKDPLYSEIMAMEEGECRVRGFEDMAGRMTAEYRDRFFSRPGFAGKTAILTVHEGRRTILNVYWEASEPEIRGAGRTSSALLALAGRLAASHFARQERPDYPLPLAVLSERERAVCAGVLAGKKSEAIAHDLGVAASSVVTYRKRAYVKLGISSRGELFAICRE